MLPRHSQLADSRLPHDPVSTLERLREEMQLCAGSLRSESIGSNPSISLREALESRHLIQDQRLLLLWLGLKTSVGRQKKILRNAWLRFLPDRERRSNSSLNSISGAGPGKARLGPI